MNQTLNLRRFVVDMSPDKEQDSPFFVIRKFKYNYLFFFNIMKNYMPFLLLLLLLFNKNTIIRLNHLDYSSKILTRDIVDAFYFKRIEIF